MSRAPLLHRQCLSFRAPRNNLSTLVRDMAHYLLATLFSLELRGAILCDTGPTNAMVRTKDPYARAVFGDAAGWSLHRKLRHRGVGGFLNIFQAYPAVQAELERILAVAREHSRLQDGALFLSL